MTQRTPLPGDREAPPGSIAAARTAESLREILQVISRSRDDEGPVFDAILRHARGLCEMPTAAMVMGQEGGGPQAIVAHHGTSDATIALYEAGKLPMDPAQSLVARAIIERRVIHLEDMAATDHYRNGLPQMRVLVDEEGIRTNLLVPLIVYRSALPVLDSRSCLDQRQPKTGYL